MNTKKKLSNYQLSNHQTVPTLSSPGFTLLEALIVVVIVAVLGLAGWYVWDKNRQDSARKATSTSQSQGQDRSKAVDSSTERSTQIDPSESGKYLVIKEQGVRITLPEKLRGDISYYVNDRAERLSGGPIIIEFVSKKFSEGSLKCAEIESTPRDLVGIYSEDFHINASPSDFTPPPFKVIGNTFYFMTGSGCQEAIEREGTPADRELLASLKEAITNTLEKYPQ